MLFPGGKIELKVLTYKPDEWPEDEDETSIAILSEEETTYFKNIVSGLLVSYILNPFLEFFKVHIVASCHGYAIMYKFFFFI